MAEDVEGDLSRIIQGNITTPIPNSFDYRMKIAVLPVSDQYGLVDAVYLPVNKKQGIGIVWTKIHDK
ncbi:unnamed protein product [Wuchereria bancrofti]|uniref:Uncharacterized protein n=1 Tax=Wuchereria bancrofti TaxID=6293 RepID=A0A3P7E762_WUCBA|nr:unnamed protein product [Wuchereria bancrofti]